jgi:DNA-binding beta-propeller fold protein YncE
MKRAPFAARQLLSDRRISAYVTGVSASSFNVEGKMNRLRAFALLLVLLLVVSSASAQAPGYKVAKKFELGGDGGWDYLTVDNASRRIFVSRSTRVMVVDADSGKLLAEIPDTPGVHGIAVANDLGRGFISAGRANSVTIFDLKTLNVISKVAVGQNPDSILYEPSSHRVFTFNGRSSDSTVIDAAKGEVVGTIPLGGKPEFSVYDDKGTIYVNIEDKSELVSIDPKTMKETARWSLAPCEEPTGLAIDRKKHRLFSACGGNKLMAISDFSAGKVIASVPIGAGSDGAGFDSDSGFAFSSNGQEGTLTIVGEESPGKFAAVQTVETQRSARTMTVDPKTHAIYLPAAKYGPPPAPTAENPRPRPVAEPGSFVLLVVSK